MNSDSHTGSRYHTDDTSQTGNAGYRYRSYALYGV